MIVTMAMMIVCSADAYVINLCDSDGVCDELLWKQGDKRMLIRGDGYADVDALMVATDELAYHWY